MQAVTAASFYSDPIGDLRSLWWKRNSCTARP